MCNIGCWVEGLDGSLGGEEGQKKRGLGWVEPPGLICGRLHYNSGQGLVEGGSPFSKANIRKTIGDFSFEKRRRKGQDQG